MRLNLLYFAWVREQIGVDSEQRHFDGAQTVADVLSALAETGPAYRVVLAEPERLRFALDREMVDRDAPVREDAELAIFPPVTGG